MLLAVALYAATLAPTSQQAAIRGEGLATLFYVSNWWAIFNGHTYFDQFLQPSPLAHTWSLGIEEQWYLIFPFLLAAVLATGRLRRHLTLAFTVGARGSALWMAILFEPGTDPSRVYFSTVTRAQDLLVGAACAALVGTTSPRRAPGYRPPGWNWLPWVALGAVLGAMLVLDDRSAALYRGGFLVYSVLCAVVIGHAVRPRGSALAHLLGRPPLRLVGLVSYGLYLWHWPVDVVLTPARTGLQGPALLALRIGVTGVIAAASFLLLEQPVRRGALERKLGPGGALTVAVASTVAVAAALVVATPTPSIAFATDGSGRSEAPAGSGISTFFVGDSVPYGLRASFDPASAPGIALTGSSPARMWAHAQDHRRGWAPHPSCRRL